MEMSNISAALVSLKVLSGSNVASAVALLDELKARQNSSEPNIDSLIALRHGRWDNDLAGVAGENWTLIQYLGIMTSRKRNRMYSTRCSTRMRRSKMVVTSSSHDFSLTRNAVVNPLIRYRVYSSSD